MKWPLYLSTILLCMVTLSSTALFWSSMPTDITGKALAAVTAVALECCKYSFFPAGIYYLRKRNGGGLLLLMMGIVLLAISVCATSGFLENAYNEQTKIAQHTSVEYQTKQQQLNSIQQQIDTLNSMIAADAKQEYRTRAYKFTAQVSELEKKRDSALLELQSTRQTSQGNAQAIFSSLADTLHSSPEGLRQSAFIGLALVVDICAVLSLLALGGLMTKKSANPPNITVENVTSKKVNAPSPAKEAEQEKTNSPQKPLTKTEQEVMQKIVAGEFGNTPGVREIIAKERIAHKSVSRIFEALIERNLARRDGKKYFLIQQVIE